MECLNVNVTALIIFFLNLKIKKTITNTRRPNTPSDEWKKTRECGSQSILRKGPLPFLIICANYFEGYTIEVRKKTTQFAVIIVSNSTHYSPYTLYTSLAQGPPFPFLHRLDRPYLPYVTWALRPVAHHPWCWTANTLARSIKATRAHFSMAAFRDR